MKKTFKTAFAGLLIVPMLAFGMTVFAPSVSAVAPGNISDGASQTKSDDQADRLFGNDGIFKTITNTALFLIGAISVLMMIYGGIKYTLSGGVAADVTAAKNTILYAVVGIVVSLLAYAIVNFVISSFTNG